MASVPLGCTLHNAWHGDTHVSTCLYCQQQRKDNEVNKNQLIESARLQVESAEHILAEARRDLEQAAERARNVIVVVGCRYKVSIQGRPAQDVIISPASLKQRLQHERRVVVWHTDTSRFGRDFSARTLPYADVTLYDAPISEVRAFE